MTNSKSHLIPRSAVRLACSTAAALGIASTFVDEASADQGLVPYVTAIPREAEGDTVTFAVFQVERYDTNFFRLPNGVDPSDSSRRGGLTSVTGVGLNLEKRYGLQRVVLNASTSKEFYSPHTNLNDTGSRVNAAYYWSVTPSLSGSLIFDYARVPTDYEYLGFVTRPNPRTTRDTRLNVDFRPGAALHPRLSFFESRYDSRDTTFQLLNSRSNGIELALLYEFPSGNNVGVFANRSNGSDLNDSLVQLQSSQDFRQTEYGALAEWKFTGQSRLTGRIGYRNHTGRDTSAIDFNGVIANLKYTYDVTGKTRFNLSVNRDLFSAPTSFSTYAQEDVLVANVEWAVTGKVTVRPQYTIRKQNYKGAALPGAVALPDTTTLNETTRYATLQVDWAALRAVDFAFSISHSNRSSTSQALQYVDNNASVFARFKF